MGDERIIPKISGERLARNLMPQLGRMREIQRRALATLGRRGFCGNESIIKIKCFQAECFAETHQLRLGTKNSEGVRNEQGRENRDDNRDLRFRRNRSKFPIAALNKIFFPQALPYGI